MASSDQELVNEVLSYLDYETIYDDVDVQAIVNIGKEEIRADIGDPALEFYQPEPDGTLHLDRALFWFTCIGLKVKTGEIGSVNLTAGSIRSTAYAGQKFEHFFENFDNKMRQAEARRFSVSMVNPSRTRRNYEDPDA